MKGRLNQGNVTAARVKAPILEVVNLGKSFGGLRAVDQVSFTQAEGSIKALIGPNGAGKSTIFNLIAGSLRPSDGRILFQGQDITGRKPHEIARLGLSRTFQAVKLSRHMTVLENVMIGVHVRSRAGVLKGLLNWPSTWKEERLIKKAAMNEIERLGLTDQANMITGGLSFGTRRAVELARALAASPKLLLLDEPASGLNSRETAELAELIGTIRDQGVSVLLVEHDMSLVMDICEDIVALNFGQLIAEGKPRDIQRDSRVIEIYLGTDDA